MYLVQILNQMH